MIEILRLTIFFIFSLIISYKDIKTRYIEDWLFALGVFFELVLLIPLGWDRFGNLLIQTLIVYFFLLFASILWVKFRKRLPFGLADIKYLTFITSFGGILQSYFSLTFSLFILIIYCRISGKTLYCKRVPFIPFLFGGFIISYFLLKLANL